MVIVKRCKVPLESVGSKTAHLRSRLGGLSLHGVHLGAKRLDGLGEGAGRAFPHSYHAIVLAQRTKFRIKTFFFFQRTVNLVPPVLQPDFTHCAQSP